MPLTSDQIHTLFQTKGESLYGGEDVSQLAHALQSAWCAEQSGASDELVIACLLHDLGHLLFEQGPNDLAEGRDDLHQYKVLPFLRPALPDGVVEPIALHVEAKRYLCQAEPGYFESLSEASRLSLALQGGPMDEAAAAAFWARPYAREAVQLRRCDDIAKVVGLPTPGLDHFMPRLQALMGETA